MTTREFYTAVSEGNITDEVIKFAVDAKAKMDKRNAERASQPSKTQIENEPVKAAILTYLRDHSGEQYTEVALGEALGITHNKAGSLVRQLVTEGKAEAAEVKVPKVGKRKVYFVIVNDDYTEDAEDEDTED